MKLIITILLSQFLLLTTKQEIKEANIKFDLPGPEWFLADKKENGKIIAYIFKREPITDSTGLHVIPNIGVIIETIDSTTDLVVFSTMKRMKTPFKVNSMFMHDEPKKEIDFKFVNALGFSSEYTDTKGRLHNTYIIHAINGNKGIQIIFDVTKSLFNQVDKEFRKTIRTIETM